MSILFQQIPSNLLVPGVFTEVNDSRASQGTFARPRRIVVVGHRLTAGAVAAGTLFKVGNESDAEYAAGVGSQLAEMLRVVKQSNRFAELYGVGLAEGASAVAASGTILCAASTPQAGTIALLIAPYFVGPTLRGRYTVSVTTSSTAAAIATAIAAAINADPYRVVDATTSTATVTLTARHAGVNGNGITIQHSFFDGEKLPTGVTLTITAMANGAVNPTLSTAIAAVGDRHVTHFVQPWVDSTNLTSLENEMVRRWGATVQRECEAFTCQRGSLSTLTTLGTSRNSPFNVTLGAGLSPTPPWICAAELAAVDANMNHPGQPLRRQQLQSMLAPAAGTEFTADERNQLLTAGIATYTVDAAGKCYVERLVTNYQLDGNSNASTIYRDRQVLGLLFAIRYDWRSFIASKYPNYMHAGDGSKYAPGLPIVTPTTLKNEFAMRARQSWQYAEGWIEDVDQFIADIVVDRTTDGIDLIGAPNLINCLHQVRTRLDFLR